MKRGVWSHHLRSPKAYAIASISFLVDVFLTVIGVIPIIRAYQESAGSPEREGVFLYLMFLVFGLLHAYHRTRYSILRLTMRYVLHSTHLYVEFGFPMRIRRKIPLHQIKKIHTVGLEGRDWVTLLLITDPVSDFQGYDFQNNEGRSWPSVEMVKDPEHVISLIRELRSKAPVPPAQPMETDEIVPLLSMVRSRLGLLGALAGLYLAVSLAFIMYTVDVKILTGNHTIETIVSTEQTINQAGEVLRAVHRTSGGHTVRTFELFAHEGDVVHISASPMLGVVTNMWKEGEYYRSALSGGLNSSLIFIYFIAFGMTFLCGMLILRREGNVSMSEVHMVIIGPLFLLLIAAIFLGTYGL